MLSELFYKGQYGLERETLRIDSTGKLADTLHQFDDNENIAKDFCENQLEIITPICDSIDELMETLGKLDKKARKELAKYGEDLWLYSNPPHFENEDEIMISNFTGDLYKKRIYFEKLETRYGKRRYLLSGVHFNFSFADEYLRSIFNDDTFETFKCDFYLKVYKQLYTHSWLLLLLTAASPVCERSFLSDGEKGIVKSSFSSIRNSSKGYWNKFIPVLDFDNYDAYIDSLKYYIDNEFLFSPAELYLPVRLKPKGEYSIENLKNGISHIEFRMFDTNPFEPLGINKQDLEFTHLFIMYLSTLEDFNFTPTLQKQALENYKNASLYDISGVKIGDIDIIKKAETIISDMTEMFKSDSTALFVLEYERSKLNDRLCTRFNDEIVSKIYR